MALVPAAIAMRRRIAAGAAGEAGLEIVMDGIRAHDVSFGSDLHILVEGEIGEVENQGRSSSSDRIAWPALAEAEASPSLTRRSLLGHDEHPIPTLGRVEDELQAAVLINLGQLVIEALFGGCAMKPSSPSPIP